MIGKLLLGASMVAFMAGAASAQNNSSTLIQTGDSHTATVDQEGGNDERSYIEQVGTLHTATTDQSGTGNDTFTDQQGEGNTATQTIAGTNGQSDVFQGFTASFGGPYDVNDGTATVTQTDTSVNNGSYIFQYMDGNSATITQSGDGERVGTAGTFHQTQRYNADVEQYGEDGTAIVDQAGAGQLTFLFQGVDVSASPEGAPVSTTPALDPGSSGNFGQVIQRVGADDAEANIYQGGLDNAGATDQRGADQFAEIRQLGDLNGADILQTDSAIGAQAFVSQAGNDNLAIVTQFSADALANVNQDGNGNITRVMQ